MTSSTSGSKQPVTTIALFASGAGSNAQQIIHYFQHKETVRIGLVVCNNPAAGVLRIAGENGIPTLLLNRDVFFKGDAYLPQLQDADVDLIILAGFLWKVPDLLINAYRNHIINIHPALLPRYGGKGMYGLRVHEAVIAAGETESGITIHFVDEHYDHGDIIFQARCPVLPGDTAETLAARIHKLEHQHFPLIIEQHISHMQAED